MIYAKIAAAWAALHIVGLAAVALGLWYPADTSAAAASVMLALLLGVPSTVMLAIEYRN